MRRGARGSPAPGDDHGQYGGRRQRLQARPLSLREAIEVSNGTLAVSSLSTQEQAQVSGAVGSTNTIDFNIPTTDPGYNAATGVWTIAVKPTIGALPTISTNAAIINGYSQPGASKNTLAQGDNAKLAIAINGASQGSFNGLTIAQQGSQVLGLDIENFLERGVLITAGGNVQVAGCFIGTDPTGETAAPNGNRRGDRELVQHDRRAERRRSQRHLRADGAVDGSLHARPGGRIR